MVLPENGGRGSGFSLYLDNEVAPVTVTEEAVVVPFLHAPINFRDRLSLLPVDTMLEEALHNLEFNIAGFDPFPEQILGSTT